VVGFTGLTLALIMSCVVAARAWRAQYALRRRLQKMERKAHEVSRMLREHGTLANELAHEIKNPLTAIVCSAEALDHLIGSEINETNRKCLEYIKQYGDSLLQMLSDYLDLNRAETDQLEFEPIPVDVICAIQSVVVLLRSNAIKRHVAVSLEPDCTNCFIEADPVQLKKMLFSLIRYTIWATPDKGTVRLGVQVVGETQKVVISACDQGPALSASQLHSLLYAPSAVMNDLSQPHAGSMLALSISRVLCEKNGGLLSAANLGSSGNRFELVFPEYQQAVETESETAKLDDNGYPLAGQRYLLVDAHVGPRESVARLIESLGGMVDQVTAAVDAVEALRKGSYDAVMLDQSSDGYRGYEMAGILKSQNNGQTPRIIVTAGSVADRRLAQAAGADVCVDKPLSSRTLLEFLRTHH